jgi:hypothetical protein
MKRVKHIILLMSVVLLMGNCGNQQKSEIISHINDYEQFIIGHKNLLSDMSVDNPEYRFARIQEIRASFLDSAGFKRRRTALYIKEGSLSETNRDEVLKRFVRAQNTAFDLYISIDNMSTDAQIYILEDIKSQIEKVINANSIEPDPESLKHLESVEKKINDFNNLCIQYQLKIERLRTDLEADNEIILDWIW